MSATDILAKITALGYQKIVGIRKRVVNDLRLGCKYYPIGMFIGLTAIASQFVLITQLGWLSRLTIEESHAPQLLGSLQQSFCSSSLEELLFRGIGCGLLVTLVKWILKDIPDKAIKLRQFLHLIIGGAIVIVTTFLWARFHKRDPELTLSILVLGLTFVAAFRRSRNIFLPMGIHLGWNFGVGIFNPGGDPRNWLVTQLNNPPGYLELATNVVGTLVVSACLWLLVRRKMIDHA